jgi:hypothetical protein
MDTTPSSHFVLSVIATNNIAFKNHATFVTVIFVGCGIMWWKSMRTFPFDGVPYELLQSGM